MKTLLNSYKQFNKQQSVSSYKAYSCFVCVQNKKSEYISLRGLIK